MPIEKHADSSVPLYPLIRSRWSPRAFADRLVEGEKIDALLEAARWSASSNNGQPWSFLIATKDQADAFKTMLSCLSESNQTWCAAVPMLMLTFARTTWRNDDAKPNRTAGFDLGLAMSQMTLQAEALGLRIHQMSGILPDRIREVYQVPALWEPMTAAAVGYQGEIDRIPDQKNRDREPNARTRLPLPEIVFAGTFGKPYKG
jgi:nitroreductase